MATARLPIKMVSSLTGLTLFVIRIWEQRYRAVTPERTNTNRRIYSEHDVERLNLLRQLTRDGHKIGLIANWPTEKLRQQASEFAPPIPPTNPKTAIRLTTPPSVHSMTQECIAAITAYDAMGLDDTLKRGVTKLGTMGMLQRVVSPLIQRVGELWITGHLTVAHEHLATSVLRMFLLNAAKPFVETKNAPCLVVATPAGQLHELGALLVGAVATQFDWKITYLGVSLPAHEIAGAALQCHARAVALSIVYPEDDSRIENELLLLRERLPIDVPILVGGRAIPAYYNAIQKIGATPIHDLLDLASKLEALRKPAPKGPAQS